MAKYIQVIKVYYLTVERFLTSNPLLLDLRYIASHITREQDMYNFNSRGFLNNNMKVYKDSLMNRYQKKLIGKVEELLYTTDNPDNYSILIQQIILLSSNSQQYFFRLYIIKYVQDMISAMLSLDASSCTLTLVNLQQQLEDRIE